MAFKGKQVMKCCDKDIEGLLEGITIRWPGRKSPTQLTFCTNDFVCFDCLHRMKKYAHLDKIVKRGRKQ